MIYTELYHHGIKGQRWGVRRFQNADGSLTAAGKKRYSYKEINQFKKQTEEDYIKANTNSKRIMALREEALNLENQYNFDPDDGGGGETIADQRAGERYMELWNQIYELEGEGEEKLYSEAGQKYVNDKLIEQFGQEEINSYNIESKARSAVATIAVLGIMATPVMLMIASDSRK